MKEYRKTGNRTSGRCSRRRRPVPELTGALVLLASVPPNGATGVDPDIAAIRLVFGREERHRHLIRDDDHVGVVVMDEFSSPVKQVIETIDMWRGFDRVKVTVRKVIPAPSDKWYKWDRSCHGDKWEWDKGCKTGRWDRIDGAGRLVYLVEPVSRLLENTTYKVRVKYRDMSKEGCRKRQSADMIVFTTGKR
ncbi:MAG: hypothetical protein ABRQ24_04635 [Syntrophomonadaceae bacterium]